MYQVSPMNWILIFFVTFFLIYYFYYLIFLFEMKFSFYKIMKKIYVK